MRAALAALWLAAPLCAQEGAAILVLGEVHDNPAHHARQAKIVAATQPAALVFEMLTSDQVAAAAGIDRRDAAALEAALGWADSGWPDFAMYAPIFAAAPAAALFGAAVPREDLAAAMADGAAAAFGPEAARFGLTPLPDEEQAAREAEQAEAHCGALPADLLSGMVEAQRLRDAAFARVALEALGATGGPVVVITGTGHARTDRGVPAALASAAPDVAVWALGQVEDERPADAPFDAVEAAPAPVRDDPCAAFEG